MVCSLVIMNGGNESVIGGCVDEWKKRGSFVEMVFVLFVFLSD